ncbi:hypothetical protein GLW05_15430 [Pontibacillus yanchengensis]|uniref:Uncharacterized protein n=1 Tax=Pontibacillus yanchengensis TaxID=462910 RepID=A0A6I4ZXT4_9BACI|nr:hypothetical protein [Pontibacillus yanchengensis]MYL34975.1 hypothetical protein [Pontibacillus yanchengensis]
MNIIKFNLYYLNLAKAYEIAMIIDNTILTSIEKESSQKSEKASGIKGNVGGITNGNKLSIGANVDRKNITSDTLREIIEVKTTKSIYLEKIINKAKNVNSLSELVEGDLIRLKNCNMYLHNEEELRQIKALRNGIFEDVKVEDFNINNLINSMLNDYAYLLKGEVGKENIIIKIPMEVESEFENLYNIDDIILGNVTVIGIYKSKVKLDSIKNTFNFFTNQNTETEEYNGSDSIINSSGTQSKEEKPPRTENEETYHFIDVIAIVQEVNIKEEKVETPKLNIVKKMIWKMKNMIKRNE